MKINTLKYIQNCLKVKTKQGEIVNFNLNSAQQKLYSAIKLQHEQNKPIRVIVLKARQMGFSTLTEGIIFKNTATKSNVTSAIVAHVEDATTNLFNMSKRFYDTIEPKIMRPKLEASNAKELVFGVLKSKIRCYTAGGSGIGRSDTILNLHISELAWWKCDKKAVLIGLLQAVPNTPSSMIIIESTANGYDYYKELWDNAISGDNDFVPLFVGWNEMPEYAMEYDGSTISPEEQQLQEQYGLSCEQIMWRRWCLKNNCGGDINLFRQEYPISPEEAFIASGTCIFDKDAVISRLAAVRNKGYEQGYFDYNKHGDTISDIKWVQSSTGYIKIYHHPKEGYPYVVGGDTAGDGSDNFVGQVLDNTSGQQVAVLCHRFDEDKYAEQMYCLGKYYNNALLGIEVNFSTYPIKTLTKLGYSKQYMRESEDSITHKVVFKHGFKTTSLTRPLIISDLVRIVRESISLINDEDTLREFLTFIRNEHGRPEAQQGGHDDRVIALAIAYYIRTQQTMSIVPTVKKRQKAFWDDDDEDGGGYSEYVEGGM